MTDPNLTEDYQAFLASKAKKLGLPFPSAEPTQPMMLPDWMFDLRKRDNTNYIYCLIDPFTSEVRYIGKSIRPKERLTNHLNEKAHCHRTHWLQEVRRKGGKPLLRILAWCGPGEPWEDLEKKWIKAGKDAGWPLTNGTEGGDGVSGLNEESRAKIINAWRGRKHRPESLVLMSQSGKGKHDHPPEWRERMRIKMLSRVFTAQHRGRLSAAVRKITDEQIPMIKARLASGERVKDLAQEFGVNRTTMSKIKMGKYPKGTQQ